MLLKSKLQMPSSSDALAGRNTPLDIVNSHFVLGTPLKPPFPLGYKMAMFGMGCFWGAEKRFWEIRGIYTTAVGYAGGFTPNPTYEEVCTGRTGHNEVVFLVYNPELTDYSVLVRKFWEAHDPTQGMRQGNDIGTQYRSGIYIYSEHQRLCAVKSKQRYQKLVKQSGYGDITTEILEAPKFYYAEDYHQQYLAKNPDGYCGLGGTGIKCPMD